MRPHVYEPSDSAQANKQFAKEVTKEWKRYWGKYSKPFEFRIVVNEMADVIKHKDTFTGGREPDPLIGSCLSEGCRIIINK